MAVPLAYPAGAVLLLADHSRFQPLLDEAVADPFDSGDVDLDRFSKAVLGPGRATVSGIGLEENTSVR